MDFKKSKSNQWYNRISMHRSVIIVIDIIHCIYFVSFHNKVVLEFVRFRSLRRSHLFRTYHIRHKISRSVLQWSDRASSNLKPRVARKLSSGGPPYIVNYIGHMFGRFIYVTKCLIGYFRSFQDIGRKRSAWPHDQHWPTETKKS